MSAFDDISLAWAGKNYAIPARKALGAIARIEEVITLSELLAYMQNGQVPLARISRAYGAVLRYAGAELEDEALYEGMFGNASAQVGAMVAVQGLIEMMIPPSIRNRANGKGQAPVLAPGEKDPMLGNSPAAVTRAPTKASSKRSSRSRSRGNGSSTLGTSGISPR